MTGMADNEMVQVETKARTDGLEITLSKLSEHGVSVIRTMWDRDAARSLRDALTRWLDDDSSPS